MNWLVVRTTLKNMTSSIGMIIPNIWENKKWQPNHQPVKNPPLPLGEINHLVKSPGDWPGLTLQSRPGILVAPGEEVALRGQ